MVRKEYLLTEEEWKEVADFYDKHRIGGGVKELFKLRFWPPFFVIPDEGIDGKHFAMLRLQNEDALCAGLAVNYIRKYPEFFAAKMLRSMHEE